MAKSKQKRNRKCPRCNNEISVVMRLIAGNTATAVAKCNSCGRSWGIGCVEIGKNAKTNIMQGYANMYRQKWNEHGIGDV